MENFQKLTEIEDAILRYAQSKKVSREKLIDTFTSKIYTKNTVKRMVDVLANDRGYIKLSDNKYRIKQIMFLDDPINEDDWEHRYVMTPLGTAYLARSSANFTSYSNISNSNIAHQSPNVTQFIDVVDLPDDLRELLKQFDSATQQKNSAAMKKVFGYIIDKSVDVGIALVTGALVR